MDLMTDFLLNLNKLEELLLRKRLCMADCYAQVAALQKPPGSAWSVTPERRTLRYLFETAPGAAPGARLSLRSEAPK